MAASNTSSGNTGAASSVDFNTASANLNSGGLTGPALSSAQSSLANAYGQNGATGANAGAAVAPPVSQTSNASDINNHLSGNTTGTVFPPPPPPPTKGMSNNTSVANPIPTATDIVNQGNAQTPAEGTNQGLLQKVAALIGQKQSQQGLNNTAEASAGVPGLTKTVNDLNTQLEGLNNQATDLQNQASAGGAIQNQEQQNVLGRGITAAGLAPQTAGDLRKNQIQQSAIASQALTLKSAIYGAQGQLSLAKDAADKAALAQYEDQQNQIDYQNALIQANLPQMTKEEKNQALLVQTQLQDRQTQITQAQDDKKTIIALATAALTNNPNDPQAQYAAQQALALSNQQQPDLTAAFNLVGKYQSNPLDTQLKMQQLIAARNTNAAANPDPNATPTDPNSQSILAQTGLSITAFNYLTQGTAALSRMTASARQQVMTEANNFLNKNGIDYSTFQSQYKAQNDVVQANVQRAAQTKVFAGEVSGSVDSLISSIKANADSIKPVPGEESITGMGSLRAADVLALMAGRAVNSKFAQTYSTQLAFVANDLAGYMAAARGASQPELTDQKNAAEVIANGMNTGSLEAFQASIKANEDKVNGVVNGAVTSAQKAVWDQFGVGSKYQSSQPSATEPTNNSKGAKWVRPDGTYVSDGTQWVKQ